MPEVKVSENSTFATYVRAYSVTVTGGRYELPYTCSDEHAAAALYGVIMAKDDAGDAGRTPKPKTKREVDVAVARILAK